MTTDTAKSILVVDDEEDVRSYLRTALEDAGFEVETACDGLDALNKVRRQAPDLISLDLVMPRHSGAKFYRELQKDRALSKIPVLIVTGHARDELGRADFDEMTISGPGVYLEKPVRSGSYVAAVRRALGIEQPESPPARQEDLREELARALSGAGADALQRALAALKKEED
jgi:CheY-like chemotaxis protein